jgi:lysozyme
VKLDLAAELCRRFEGFSAKPYLCPAGVWTIGYGSTYYANGDKVTKDDPSIDREYAERLLMHELVHTYAPGAIRQCPILLTVAIKDKDWGKLNAIVDFCYNLGVGRLQTSTLKRKINQQDWDGAIEQLKLWVRGGGKVLRGLVIRRDAEAALMR